VNFGAVIRWWPAAGLLATLSLGGVVGKRSTPIDDWFQGSVRGALGPLPRWLLIFTDQWLLAAVPVVCMAITLYQRRWRLATAIVVLPVVAILAVSVLKNVFDRYKGDALAYPSGHVTTTVAVIGLAVIVVGPRMWAIAVAIAVCVLGIVGQACTYHYFTDTIGGVLLGTALLCAAWQLIARDATDRCPRVGRPDTSSAVP
jgi:membrane-associated phospholipid phosphatase